jgi:hypothetical protein
MQELSLIDQWSKKGSPRPLLGNMSLGMEAGWQIKREDFFYFKKSSMVVLQR